MTPDSTSYNDTAYAIAVTEELKVIMPGSAINTSTVEEALQMGWFNERKGSKEEKMKKHVLKMRSIR